MASFLSIIKSIGHAVETVLGMGLTAANAVETAAEPVVAILNPAAGAILQKVQTVTAALEAMVTSAQSGQQKSQTAVQILQSEIPLLQEVITATGSGFQLNTTEAQNLVNSSVALYNAINAVVSQFKTPPAPATNTATTSTPPPA